jgi:hypothetical protein
MAFGRTDPEAIIGMTPDELKDRLGKIEALETRLQSLDEGTREQSTKLEAILSTLESLKPKPEPPDPVLDPEGALDARLGQIHNQTLANTIMIQHQKAREMYPRDFEKWGPEIVAKVGEYSPEHQCDPRVWKNAVLVVRGDHIQDIEKDAWNHSPIYLEPVSAGLKRPKGDDGGLNPAERKMIEHLRHAGPVELTPEKYRRGQERLAKARLERLGSMGRAMQEAS